MSKEIKSNRLWEYIDYILKETKLFNKKDEEVSINITYADLVWILLNALFECIELEQYEFLDGGQDKDIHGYKMYKTKASERFNKLFNALNKNGVNMSPIIEIGHIRSIIEFAELNNINDILRELADIPSEE